LRGAPAAGPDRRPRSRRAAVRRLDRTEEDEQDRRPAAGPEGLLLPDREQAGAERGAAAGRGAQGDHRRQAVTPYRRESPGRLAGALSVPRPVPPRGGGGRSTAGGAAGRAAAEFEAWLTERAA